MNFKNIFTSRKTLIESEVRKIAEAIPMTLGVDDDDWKYRKLTGQPTKDMPSYTHERMLKISHHLYNTNPMAKRIIEMTKDFVVGGGFTFRAKDEKVQALLESFWNDPVNNWNMKQHNKTLELGLYGEQIYPVQITTTTGRVRLGYIDPLQIDKVIVDPQNNEILTQLKLKGTPMAQSKTLDIIRGNDAGNLEGDCFFFAINKVSNATRGTSDIFVLADWIDAYDQFLFNRLDRSALINSFVWDVELKGMNEADMKEWLRRNPAPKPGSIRCHNENVVWNAVSPDLKASDATKEARMIKNFILGGAGLPEHWFAEGGETNRATAAEMGTPTLKRLRNRQAYIINMIENIFNFVIAQAQIAGTLTSTDTSFEIYGDEIMVSDLGSAVAVLKDVVMSTTLAIQAGLMSKETAVRMVAKASELFGDEIDLDAERELIDKQGSGVDYADTN